jgi:hypothetical protein
MFEALWPNNKPCVIIASIGRSGSTLVFNTLKKEAKKTLWRKKSGLTPTLADAKLKTGTICKTHDFPDALVNVTKPVKAVFIFGSTLESAMSVHSCVDRFGPDWVAQHFKHLKSDGHANELFDYDALGLAKQVKSWSTFDSVPTLCVRYDALWRRAAEIAEFTNYNFELPEFKPRTEKQLNNVLLEKAQEIYGPLDDVVMALPEIFLASSSMAPQVSKL